MQISRHLLLTCAVAACLTPTLVHAADNEAQIRARQALEEKMTQMPAATALTNPPPMVTKPKAAAVKPAPPVVTVTPNSATVENQPAPSATIHVATPSNDNATQQKLEDALHASQPRPAVQEPAPPVVEKPAPVVQQAMPTVAPVAPKTTTVESQPAPSTPSYISAPSNDDATNQKLQEALRQKMQQTPAEPTPPAVATQKPAKAPRPTAAKPAPTTTANYATQPEPTPAPTATYAPVPMTSSSHPNLPEQPTPQPAPMPVATKNQPPTLPSASLPALQGPATGLSSAKEQKLNELLNQYRADQVTPQQYQEQRAKILAEP